MRKQSFLAKLQKGGKLKLITPSDIIADSYLQKADSALNAASLLFENSFLEESIFLSYYAIYYSLIALFRKCGIKSEAHTGTIILFKKLFDEDELFEIISDAKKARIDTQYYISLKITKMEAEELLEKAEDFVLKLNLIVGNINSTKLKKIRKRFIELVL